MIVPIMNIINKCLMNEMPDIMSHYHPTHFEKVKSWSWNAEKQSACIEHVLFGKVTWEDSSAIQLVSLFKTLPSQQFCAGVT